MVGGHLRLTACMLFPQYLPAELEIFLGEAEGLEGCGLY